MGTLSTRPKSPVVILTWHASKYKVCKLRKRYILPCTLRMYVTLYTEDAPLVEFTYLVFTCMPGESYHKRLRSLL